MDLKKSKQRQVVPINDPQRMFQILFHESAAGIQVSGDSGSGKSIAMAGIVQSLVGSIGGLIIDPHGDLSRLIFSLCMKLGAKVADRVVYVRHSDTSNVPTINPLAMPEDDNDPLAWGGMLTAKVEHFVNILLAAWGEFDLNGKTILQRNLYRIFSSLADLVCQLRPPRCSWTLTIRSTERFFAYSQTLLPSARWSR